MTSDTPRVLLVAEHASATFGGEAALPFHYFRALRKRQIDVWLVVHERTRDELKLHFGEDFDRISFITDTVLHRLLCKLGGFLPQRVDYFTFGFALRLITQATQRKVVRQLVQRHQITVVHQPIPVSPKEPSLIFDVGAPVIIGPLNGGMDYPPAFQWMQSRFVNLTVTLGRLLSNGLNGLMPGKQRAAALLVANARTRAALPKGISARIIDLPENGVDLSVWQPTSEARILEHRVLEHHVLEQAPLAPEPLGQAVQQPATKFVFVGRLVHWKSVNLLLLAFERVAKQLPVALEIIGDGPEGKALRQQARSMGLLGVEAESQPTDPKTDQPSQSDRTVHFRGWLSQADCVQRVGRSDVMVLPSMLECGGAVVLESMAMGIPVIATNWGGPSDYLNASCGILIEPRSRELFISDLAAAMTQMARSPELRRSMGEMGRRRVVSHFDWDVKVDAILKIYRGVLEPRLTQGQPMVSQHLSSAMRNRRIDFETKI